MVRIRILEAVSSSWPCWRYRLLANEEKHGQEVPDRARKA